MGSHRQIFNLSIFVYKSFNHLVTTKNCQVPTVMNYFIKIYLITITYFDTKAFIVATTDTQNRKKAGRVPH